MFNIQIILNVLFIYVCVYGCVYTYICVNGVRLTVCYTYSMYVCACIMFCYGASVYYSWLQYV